MALCVTSRLIDSGNQWVFKYYSHVQANFSVQTKTILEFCFRLVTVVYCLPNIGIWKGRHIPIWWSNYLFLPDDLNAPTIRPSLSIHIYFFHLFIIIYINYCLHHFCPGKINSALLFYNYDYLDLMTFFSSRKENCWNGIDQWTRSVEQTITLTIWSVYGNILHLSLLCILFISLSSNLLIIVYFLWALSRIICFWLCGICCGTFKALHKLRTDKLCDVWDFPKTVIPSLYFFDFLYHHMWLLKAIF